jgi:Rad3-related DNA helicase
MGRFAITLKVPFPNLKDERVKKKMAGGNRWYDWITIAELIQSGGRVVRSESDWGYHYILDKCAGSLLRRNLDILPDWWKEALEGVI